MFEPRQIFSVVYDDDGTRTIYKVNESIISIRNRKNVLCNDSFNFLVSITCSELLL